MKACGLIAISEIDVDLLVVRRDENKMKLIIQRGRYIYD
jgi:hypothetical protein